MFVDALIRKLTTTSARTCLFTAVAVGCREDGEVDAADAAAWRDIQQRETVDRHVTQLPAWYGNRVWQGDHEGFVLRVLCFVFGSVTQLYPSLVLTLSIGWQDTHLICKFCFGKPRGYSLQDLRIARWESWKLLLVLAAYMWTLWSVREVSFISFAPVTWALPSQPVCWT